MQLAVYKAFLQKKLAIIIAWISPFNDNRRISIFQLNPKQVGRKTKVCYSGYNRYDNETENFIERYLGKNG